MMTACFAGWGPAPPQRRSTRTPHHTRALALRAALLALGLWLGAAAADESAPAALSGTITGGEFEYVIQPADHLTKIGARYGVDPVELARANGIDYHGYIHPGQRLRIDNRHIVPELLAEGILINLPQRMLYFFRDGALRAAYPVGLGRPTWRTPTGDYAVRTLDINKEWIVPRSIQEEMRREGQIVRERVPPGPDNPLGKHWIGLSRPSYGIHGTIAPASVYHFQSHGCIRLHPDDIAAIFDELRPGMPVRIIYRATLLAQLPDGRIFLEAHPDAYNKGDDPQATQQARALEGRIDGLRARAVLAGRAGVARDITRQDENR